jgi:hypothetical protein
LNEIDKAAPPFVRDSPKEGTARAWSSMESFLHILGDRICFLNYSTEQEFRDGINAKRTKGLEKYLKWQFREKNEGDLPAIGYGFAKAVSQEFGMNHILDLLYEPGFQQGSKVSLLELCIPKYYINRVLYARNG